jgi:hypothetical protein
MVEAPPPRKPPATAEPAPKRKATGNKLPATGNKLPVKPRPVPVVDLRAERWCSAGGSAGFRIKGVGGTSGDRAQRRS